MASDEASAKLASARVVLKHGDDQYVLVDELGVPQVLRVGTHKQNDIHLSSVDGTSFHARFEGASIVDEGAGVGSLVNGVEVPRKVAVSLLDGNVVTIAGEVFSVEERPGEDDSVFVSRERAATEQVDDVEAVQAQAKPGHHLSVPQMQGFQNNTQHNRRPTVQIDAKDVAGIVTAPLEERADSDDEAGDAEHGYKLVHGEKEYRIVSPDGQAECLTIGRHAMNDVVLTHRTISGRHAVVRGLSISDEASTNGTFVNGSRIPSRTPVKLRLGDQILIGADSLAFRVEEGMAPRINYETQFLRTGSSYEAGNYVLLTPRGSTVEPQVQPSALQLAEPRAITLLWAETQLEYALVDEQGHQELYTIGRHQVNDIVIPDALVSGRHATIQGATLVDNGSTNGTTVNGKQVPPKQEIHLKEGDEVVIGESTFKIVSGNASLVPDLDGNIPSSLTISVDMVEGKHGPSHHRPSRTVMKGSDSFQQVTGAGPPGDQPSGLEARVKQLEALLENMTLQLAEAKRQLPVVQRAERMKAKKREAELREVIMNMEFAIYYGQTANSDGEEKPVEAERSVSQQSAEEAGGGGGESAAELEVKQDRPDPAPVTQPAAHVGASTLEPTSTSPVSAPPDKQGRGWCFASITNW